MLPISFENSLLSIRKVHTLCILNIPSIWEGESEGTVEVKQPGENIITFHETGNWLNVTQNKTPLSFKNSLKWELNYDLSINLSHMRYGESAIVNLVTLKPVSITHWTSASPHICGEDIYVADLEISNNSIILNWKINGPKKDTKIRSVYTGNLRV